MLGDRMGRHLYRCCLDLECRIEDMKFDDALGACACVDYVSIVVNSYVYKCKPTKRATADI